MSIHLNKIWIKKIMTFISREDFYFVETIFISWQRINKRYLTHMFYIAAVVETKWVWATLKILKQNFCIVKNQEHSQNNFLCYCILVHAFVSKTFLTIQNWLITGIISIQNWMERTACQDDLTKCVIVYIIIFF